jgi:hypothetical protein
MQNHTAVLVIAALMAASAAFLLYELAVGEAFKPGGFSSDAKLVPPPPIPARRLELEP